MTLHDREFIAQAAKPRVSTTVFMRKRLLHRRIELESQWQQLFPRHSFSDLRLIRSPLDWDEEAWGRAARAYHEERTRVSRRTQKAGAAEMSTRAAGSTVEALAHQLRGGIDALREPSALRRLSELDETQMREIADRLARSRWGQFKKGEMVPWTSEEIEAFAKLWRINRQQALRSYLLTSRVNRRPR
jgi:hypothetical protein